MAVCPDFASETFARRRQSITSSGLSEQQIIEFMWGTCHDANEADKRNWALVVQGKQVEDEDTAKMWDELAARMEARKKNYNAYGMLPIPTYFPKFPSDAAMSKLRKGEHVPLWHFTNEGLESARENRDEYGAEFARISGQERDWKALMRYADEQRQLWHMRTKDVMAGNTVLRILKIDKDLLNTARNDVDVEMRFEHNEQMHRMMIAMVQEQERSASPPPNYRHNKRQRNRR